MECPTCGSDNWRPWGSHVRHGREVPRARCRECGRTWLREPTSPQAGLRVGRSPAGREGGTRFELFWREAAGQCWTVGLSSALAEASRAAGVHRTTGWRWARTAAVSELERPAEVSETGWHMFLRAIEQFRQGRDWAVARRDPARWTCVSKGGRDGPLFRTGRHLVESMVEASVIAGMSTGRAVPVWVDRLSALYEVDLPPEVPRSDWESFRRYLARIPTRFMERFRTSAWSQEEAAAFLNAWSVTGVADAWMRFALERGRYISLLAPLRRLPRGTADLVLQSKGVKVPPAIEAWMRGKPLPAPLDDGAIRSWFASDVVQRLESTVRRAISSEERQGLALLYILDGWVVAEVRGNGSGVGVATRRLSRRTARAMREQTWVLARPGRVQYRYPRGASIPSVSCGELRLPPPHLADPPPRPSGAGTARPSVFQEIPQPPSSSPPGRNPGT